MKSMNEKIYIAHDLACDLVERLNEGTLEAPGEVADMIWGHAEGLIAKHLYKMRDGRCSLAALIAFDPAKAEADLDDEILVMEGLA